MPIHSDPNCGDTICCSNKPASLSIYQSVRVDRVRSFRSVRRLSQRKASKVLDAIGGNGFRRQQVTKRRRSGRLNWFAYPTCPFTNKVTKSTIQNEAMLQELFDLEPNIILARLAVYHWKANYMLVEEGGEATTGNHNEQGNNKENMAR